MIREYFSDRKQELWKHPSVIDLSFDSTITDEDKGFWKAKITFRDGSKLHLFEFVLIENNKTVINKYRYHYQDKDKDMIFRFDDAAHHKEIETFPEHKHEKDEIVAAERPELDKVLDLVANHISG